MIPSLSPSFWESQTVQRNQTWYSGRASGNSDYLDQIYSPMHHQDPRPTRKRLTEKPRRQASLCQESTPFRTVSNWEELSRPWVTLWRSWPGKVMSLWILATHSSFIFGREVWIREASILLMSIVFVRIQPHKILSADVTGGSMSVSTFLERAMSFSSII